MQQSSLQAAIAVPFLLLSYLLSTQLQAAELVIHCVPAHAVKDFRANRPQYVADFIPSQTYFLFDNLDLFEFEVELMNFGARPIALSNPDWASQFSSRFLLNGTRIPEEGLSVEVVRKLLKRTVYTNAGKPLSLFEFKLRETGLGAVPSQPFDDFFEIAEDVDVFPIELAPNETFSVRLKIGSSRDEALERGLYTVDFWNEALRMPCGRESLVVATRPQSSEDIVDDHIVRYKRLMEAGLIEAAGLEIQAATTEAPSELVGWYYLAVFGFETGDLQLRADAAEEIHNLLDDNNKALDQVPRDLRSFVRYTDSRLESFRQEALRAEALKAKDAAAPPGAGDSDDH